MASQPHRRTFGRKTQNNRAWVINRDHATCGICGHPDADSLGHILPVATHPELEHHPDNWQAQHLYARTLTEHGYDCIGNAAQRDRTTTQPPTRTW